MPALLVFYERSHVPESPAWQAQGRSGTPRPGLMSTLRQNWRLALYAVVLMTAFIFFSHGTQDLYPTFLRVQHGFEPQTVSMITVILNVGAIIGGLGCGWLSERIGRRWVIFGAALLALPILPLWTYSTTPAMLALGAFLMQIAVQGAWGVVPVHLNEISPDAIRATFPGLVYQLGNLLDSVNAELQSSLAPSHGNDYGPAMAVVGSPTHCPALRHLSAAPPGGPG